MALGGASTLDPDDFATAAQGALADTAVQPGDLGTAAAADATDFATAAQGALADTSIQPGDLGTAAAEDVGAFATAAQGALAATAIQPGDASLSDAREWTATEVSQAEAEGGSSTTPRKWTALRVRQAAAAWWASLLDAGKIPSSLLPSYVDDVIEAASFAALPLTGEAGKIYVTLDDGKQHRWSGSSYITWESSPGSTDAVAEGSLNLYFTTARALAAVTWGTLTGIPSWITSSGAFGRSFVASADQAAGRTALGLGSAAFTSSGDYATAAQGALADSSVQPGDLGTAAAQDVTAFATAAQGALADSSIQPADLGTAAAEDVGAFATAAQGALADTAVQPGDLGSAAAADVADFATAAQGALAATAVQPEDLTAASGVYQTISATPPTLAELDGRTQFIWWEPYGDSLTLWIEDGT